MYKYASRYKNQLQRVYLEPGRAQADLIVVAQTIRRVGDDKHEARHPGGIRQIMTTEEYMALPMVHAQTLVTDFWNLYELAINQLKDPTVIATQRIIFEQVYKKLLQYVHHTDELKRIIAIKSWALTQASMVRRASDPLFLDEDAKAAFMRWINLLPESEKNDFTKIKDENFETKRLSQEMMKVYKGLHTLSLHPQDLIKADGSEINPRAIIVINNYLNGYVHGNSAQVSNMISDMETGDHLPRNRTFLMTTGIQAMHLVNKYLISEPVSLSKQTDYYRRVEAGIMARLSREN